MQRKKTPETGRSSSRYITLGLFSPPHTNKATAMSLFAISTDIVPKTKGGEIALLPQKPK